MLDQGDVAGSKAQIDEHGRYRREDRGEVVHMKPRCRTAQNP